MTRKHIAEAVVGEDDYLIVKHTHSIGLARAKMREALKDDYYPDRGSEMLERRLANPVQVYMRIIRALPNSESAAIGWAYSFREEPGPARGAFKAVVFR